jgi:hypothetical protein
MSGIMAAVAGGAQNVIYGAGLYNTSYGVELSPIDYSGSSAGGSTFSVTYTWIGYYRPAATGTVALGMTGTYTEYLTNYGQYNWNGGGYVNGYLWLGPTAISGYNTGNANVSIYNNTASYSPSLVSGIYYPIRLQSTMVLPWRADIFGVFYDGYAQGAFAFTSGGTSTVTNLIWYNTKTNGF